MVPDLHADLCTDMHNRAFCKNVEMQKHMRTTMQIHVAFWMQSTRIVSGRPPRPRSSGDFRSTTWACMINQLVAVQGQIHVDEHLIPRSYGDLSLVETMVHTADELQSKKNSNTEIVRISFKATLRTRHVPRALRKTEANPPFCA